MLGYRNGSYEIIFKITVFLLKKSISETNSTDTTDNSITGTTDLLRKHIEYLLQENASKNTIIKILAENQQHASNTKEVVSSESFKTVKVNFIKNHYKPKSQNLCSNRYDTLYPTDDSDESDSSSDAETLSSGSTKEVMQYIRQNRFRSKHKLISPKIKLSTDQCYHRKRKHKSTGI